MEIILNTKARLNGHGYSASFYDRYVFTIISTFIGQNPKFFFYACVEEGCSASLTIAREKQT